MIGRALVAAALAAVLVAGAGSADAAVKYTVTFGAKGPAGFSYTAADFLTSNVDIPIANLDSCTPALGVCTDAQLGFNPDLTVFALLLSGDGVSTNVPAGANFEQGALSAPGVYGAVGGIGGSTLTVTDLGASAPEPGAWALMLLGFTAVGGLLRWRRDQAQPA